jgi:hypothetical protein
MTLRRPVWMQPDTGDPEIEYSAVEDRLVATAAIRTSGVVTGMAVTQRGAGANFSVDVAAGIVAVTGQDTDDQGRYVCQSTAVENVAVPAPPGAGTRTHRVVAWVKDPLHNGAYTDYEWTIELLEDTGTGTPTLPDSAIDLAYVAVTSSTTSITNSEITDKRINAQGLPGRPLQVSSDAGRPAVPYISEEIYRTDKGYFEWWNGLAWKIRAALLTPVSASSETDVSTSSTSYTAGSPQVSTTFVAPPSGIVYVTVSAAIECAAPSTASCSWEIRNTSVAGSVVVAADDRSAVMVQEDHFVSASYRKLVTGLTAGNTYFIRTMHKTSGAGAADLFWREILVEPHGS